jgi:hypothetical protein
LRNSELDELALVHQHIGVLADLLVAFEIIHNLLILLNVYFVFLIPLDHIHNSLLIVLNSLQDPRGFLLLTFDHVFAIFKFGPELLDFGLQVPLAPMAILVLKLRPLVGMLTVFTLNIDL